MDLPDAVSAVISRRQPAGRLRSAQDAPGRAGWTAARTGQRRSTVRAPAGYVLDRVQLGVLVRDSGLLPGPGPLEGEIPRWFRSCRSRSRPILVPCEAR